MFVMVSHGESPLPAAHPHASEKQKTNTLLHEPAVKLWSVHNKIENVFTCGLTAGCCCDLQIVSRKIHIKSVFVRERRQSKALHGNHVNTECRKVFSCEYFCFPQISSSLCPFSPLFLSIPALISFALLPFSFFFLLT